MVLVPLAIMDGYTTPPQFPINPVYVHPQMGPGLQYLYNQLQNINLHPPVGPEVADYSPIPFPEPIGTLDEPALLRLGRLTM